MEKNLSVLKVIGSEINGGHIYYNNGAIGHFYIDGNMDETIVDYVTLNGRTLKSEKFLKKYTSDDVVKEYKKKILDDFNKELEAYNNIRGEFYLGYANVEVLKSTIEDIREHYDKFYMLNSLMSTRGTLQRCKNDRLSFVKAINRKTYIVNSLMKLGKNHPKINSRIQKMIDIIDIEHDFSDKNTFLGDLALVRKIQGKYKKSIVDDFDKITTYAISNNSTGEIKESTPKIIYKVFKSEIGLENTLFLLNIGKNKIGDTIYELTKNYPKRKEKIA